MFPGLFLVFRLRDDLLLLLILLPREDVEEAEEEKVEGVPAGAAEEAEEEEDVMLCASRQSWPHTKARMLHAPAQLTRAHHPSPAPQHDKHQMVGDRAARVSAAVIPNHVRAWPPLLPPPLSEEEELPWEC